MEAKKGTVRVFSLAQTHTHALCLSDLYMSFLSVQIYLNNPPLYLYVKAVSPCPRRTLSDSRQKAFRCEVILVSCRKNEHFVTLVLTPVSLFVCGVNFKRHDPLQLCQDNERERTFLVD